jgi:hypothetical protein
MVTALVGLSTGNVSASFAKYPFQTSFLTHQLLSLPLESGG